MQGQLGFAIRTPRRKRVRRRGRPRIHAFGCSPHKIRRRFHTRMPVHVTMRLDADVRNARKRDIYRAIQRATVTAALKQRIRIVHFSIQRTHLHAIVEVDGSTDLSRGMQGFQIAAARRINHAISRTGRVFSDRYHAHYLASPRETRNAIRYVLNNWRHHREDRHHPFSGFHIDPFSSAIQFTGFTDWNRDCVLELRRLPRNYEALLVFIPRTWLLSTGWRERGGGRFSVAEIPTPTSPSTPSDPR